MSQKKEHRSLWLTVRLTPSEHARLTGKAGQTTSPKLSDYCRRILFDRPLTTFTRNQSVDEFIEEMALLRRELSRDGNNLNQAVRRLNILEKPGELARWAETYACEVRAVDSKISEIKQKLNEFNTLWLQGSK